MMTIEELRRALEQETAGLHVNMPVKRVQRRARYQRRRQALGIAAAVLLIAGTLVGIYAYPRGGPGAIAPADSPVPSSSTLYYSDGTTVLAKLGDSETATSMPVGLVVNHVLDELSHSEGSPLKGKSWPDIRNGGYAITTTIDARAQQVLEQSADATVADSVMAGQPENLQAAGAVVEPGTGRVLAYYGGRDGLGTDYAGFYFDEQDEAVGFGRHPAGFTFTAYTIAAALKAGISLQSKWQWTQHEQPGRSGANMIRNASVCIPDRFAQSCTLLQSSINALNVPLYDVTVAVTPAKVLAMARDAGIDSMWDDMMQRHDLRTSDPVTLTPQFFDLILGIGQYSVTVLDQANAMATFAAGGLRAKVHFVRTVKRAGKDLYAETLPKPDQGRILNKQQMADLTYALNVQNRPDGPTVRTGTWEYNGRPEQNAHAWSIGYTSKLATAIWVGNKAEERALIDKGGATIWGSGLPTQILMRVVSNTQTQLGLTPERFPEPAYVGDLNPPGSMPS